MIRAATMPPDRLRAAVEAQALRPIGQAARAAADVVARAGGEAVRGLLFFGSRRTAAAPDPWSAYDFFVATRGYIHFYEALRAAGQIRRRPSLLAALNRCMPPNQVHLRWRDPAAGEGLAKCAVIDMERLARETTPNRHDHFCVGRLFQPASLAYSADEEARETLLDALTRARRATYAWVRPWLPERFDVEDYCRSLLEVSMRWEIRPEPRSRVLALWQAQRDEQLGAYSLLLQELLDKGELGLDDGTFTLRRPVTRAQRLRSRLYFARSLARATLRWPKYVLSVDGWLDYLLRKVERRTGHRIEPSASERKLPLLLLWGKFYRFWRSRDRRPDG
jgi:hypothetical protein